MSTTLGERVIEAVAALLESVRIVDGWLTESGSDVRREEVGVEIADGSAWISTINTRELDLSPPSNAPVVRAVRRFTLSHGVQIDTYARLQDGDRPGSLIHRIAADHRRVIATDSGALSDPEGRLGVIELVSTEPIREGLGGGVIGVRTQINITHIEAWGDPSQAL